MGFLDLKGDGPTVVEAPPKMLGAAMDTLQRLLVDIGPLGPDKGKGGKYLFLPPGYKGEVPEGYFVVKSPTYSVSYFLRGFKVDGKTDQAVALMKQTKVYPLAKAAKPPKMEFLNGSGKPIDTIHSDTHHVFRDARPARERGAGRRLHAAGTLLHAVDRHRKGQAVQPRREGQGAALGSRARRRRDGAGQQLRLARSRHVTTTRTASGSTSATCRTPS